MRRTSFSVILLCIVKCGFVLAICTVSKHEGGSAHRLQCSNVTLRTILEQTTNVSALLVFDSNFPYITERAFIKYAKHLLFLNIYNCHVYDIHADAFDSLASLRKLSLPSNNITEVKEAWFKDLVYLEQLDLSFNRIEKIAPAIFSRIPLLKRFDIRENRITCLDPSAFPGGIDKIYFLGNPLALTCRGELTLWMRDHGVNYKTEQSKEEEWLDKLLWLCAMDDVSAVKSEDSMKECVILNLFNQLRTGLSTAQSYPLSVDCPVESNLLMACLATGAAEDALPLGRSDMPMDDISSAKKSLSRCPSRQPRFLSGIIPPRCSWLVDFYRLRSILLFTVASLARHEVIFSKHYYTSVLSS